ncbi:RarD protein [Escherichia coli]|uniref:RarD protein n=1 Tax=Escherichia coli TaxID=562 RepID=A0A376VQZ8_ECOLX|nr:RarD protein [Escherichia coli]
MQNKRGRAYYSLLPLIFIWGIAPAYFKLIYYVPADEILTHRVIWSFFFMVVLMSICRQWSYLKTLIQTPQKIFMLAVSAVLIGGNWLLFIWAVNNHHMLEASLGYFINPLVNIVLGDDFPRRAIPPDAMAGGDSGDMWRVGSVVDFWFTADYRAGAGV